MVRFCSSAQEIPALVIQLQDWLRISVRLVMPSGGIYQEASWCSSRRSPRKDDIFDNIVSRLALGAVLCRSKKNGENDFKDHLVATIHLLEEPNYTRITIRVEYDCTFKMWFM
ncbi:hypothetical protein Tco_0714129 [Tanacetum coccineum]